MKKAFGIYRFNQHYGRRGFWERCGKYETPERALQAIKDLTKRPKKERIFVYCILPSIERERWLLIKDHEKLLKSAR